MTLGQQWLGINVESLDGSRISPGRALVRCAVMLLPFELNHAVLFHLMPKEGASRTAFCTGYALVWAVIAVYGGSVVSTQRGQSITTLSQVRLFR